MNIYTNITSRATNWTLGFGVMGAVVPALIEHTVEDAQHTQLIRSYGRLMQEIYTLFCVATVYAPRTISFRGAFFWVSGTLVCLLSLTANSDGKEFPKRRKFGVRIQFISRVVSIVFTSLAMKKGTSKVLTAISLTLLNMKFLNSCIQDNRENQRPNNPFQNPAFNSLKGFLKDKSNPDPRN